jgi:hypothetical protein
MQVESGSRLSRSPIGSKYVSADMLAHSATDETGWQVRSLSRKNGPMGSWLNPNWQAQADEW